MSQVKTATVRIANGNQEHGTGVWVDRRSPLGNPFKVEQWGRSQAVALYKLWLADQLLERPASPQLEMLRQLRELAGRPQGVVLICHCQPLECHAREIARLLHEGFSRPDPV